MLNLWPFLETGKDSNISGNGQTFQHADSAWSRGGGAGPVAFCFFLKLELTGRALKGGASKHSAVGRERVAYFFWQVLVIMFSQEG